MNSLLDITKDFTTNAGGVIEINIALLEDIASFPMCIGNIMANGFRMKSGKTFHRFYFTLDTCKFSQSINQTVHGAESSCSLPFAFPSPTDDDIYLFDRMERMKFIVIPKDNNGFYRVMGSPESPAVFTSNFTTNEEFIKSQKCVCGFSSKTTRSAPYYTGNFNQVVYNEGYNFGFLRNN